MGRKSLAEQRRREIIDAFYQCVLSQGFANASIRKIAFTAGVQPSVLHHYFKDRNEMIAAMVANYAETLFDEIIAGLKDCTDPRERLFKALEFLFSSSMINEDTSGFFLECCAEARTNPQVREILAGIFRSFRLGIIEYMKDVPPLNRLTRQQQDLCASLIIAIHEGLELQWYMNSDDVSLEASYDLIRGMIEMVVSPESPVSMQEKLLELFSANGS